MKMNKKLWLTGKTIKDVLFKQTNTGKNMNIGFQTVEKRYLAPGQTSFKSRSKE